MNRTRESPPLDEGGDRLRGQDMLCFSHDWTGDPLSKTHLMRLLARENRILWVNSIGYRRPTVTKADVHRAWRKLKAAAEPVREVERNIFVLNPLAIPAYEYPAVRSLNRIWLRQQVRSAMNKLQFRAPLNWVFNPAAEVVAGSLGEQQIIYYCVDEYTAFTGVSSDRLGALENRLIQRADTVLVSSDRLYQSKVAKNRRTFLVRHGVDFEHFQCALLAETSIPHEIATLPRPVIGFFGLVADWVDVELMAAVAKRFSQGSLVVVGKAIADVSALQRLPNVHLLGRKPYEELPNYCKGFDVALNPFRINELTLNANPLKVREYLAAGLPVVSTAIPEVQVLDHCRIGSNAADFIRQIELALLDPGPTQERSDSIRHESWAARLDEIRVHLAGKRS